MGALTQQVLRGLTEKLSYMEPESDRGFILSWKGPRSAVNRRVGEFIALAEQLGLMISTLPHPGRTCRDQQVMTHIIVRGPASQLQEFVAGMAELTS